jgi:hypothetical protein
MLDAPGKAVNETLLPRGGQRRLGNASRRDRVSAGRRLQAPCAENEHAIHERSDFPRIMRREQ